MRVLCDQAPEFGWLGVPPRIPGDLDGVEHLAGLPQLPLIHLMLTSRRRTSRVSAVVTAQTGDGTGSGGSNMPLIAAGGLVALAGLGGGTLMLRRRGQP